MKQKILVSPNQRATVWIGLKSNNIRMSSPISSPNTAAAILARVIEASEGKLLKGAAEYPVAVRFGERDVARINELSELAQHGKLAGEEQAELAAIST